MTSADYAKSARITFDQWCARMQKPGYAYKNTAWYKATKALEAETHPKPVPPSPVPPPAPVPDPLVAYRSILFMAQAPISAEHAPSYYKVAFTADPAYNDYAMAATAQDLRDLGHLIYVWYVPTEVSKARADEVALRLGPRSIDPNTGEEIMHPVPVILGQCETAEQFDASLEHGRRAMVGNLSSLRPDQLERVASGQNVVVNENYRGCGAGAPDWKNANAGVAGNCLACYQDGDCQRIPLAEQIANGWFVPHRDSLYGPGLTAEDWAALT